MGQDDPAGPRPPDANGGSRRSLAPAETRENNEQMPNRNRAEQPTNALGGPEDIEREETHQGPSGAHEAVAAPPPAGRITVALAKKAVEDLEKARQTTGYSKTDIVNRAISMYAFVEEELHEDAEFLIRRKDGTQYLLKSY